MTELESSIRRHHEAGNLPSAATVALEGYGAEVLGYLVATLHDHQAASEVFSDLTEDLWRGLPSFQWRSSFRTWLYTLARHAAVRYARDPKRRRERNLPLSQVSEVAERLRSSTLAHLRTEVKDRFADIRRGLQPDDQTLLILRVDRKMSWNDIARVFAGDEVEEHELARVSARMRKRFQLLKKELRERVRVVGRRGD